MSDHVTANEDDPAVLYRYTRDEPGAVIAGVAARDLTVYDLASYSPEQRAALEREAKRKDGAYQKAGTIPAVLRSTHESPDDADEAEPAATSGKKG